jgi:hypothetical protein
MRWRDKKKLDFRIYSFVSSKNAFEAVAANNILQILVFALFAGIALSASAKGAPLVRRGQRCRNDTANHALRDAGTPSGGFFRCVGGGGKAGLRSSFRVGHGFIYHHFIAVDHLC